jgi:hypothetical protein
MEYSWEGGVARSTDLNFLVTLRNGSGGVVTYSILPGLDPSNVIYTSSNLDVNSGVLKTNFEGQAWVTTPNPF